MGNPLFDITYGLYIVTTNADSRDNGCISNTFLQVADKPLQVSVCLNKANLTTEMIRKSGVFTASILSQQATFDLIKHFGFQSGRDTDKFKDFTDCKRVANGTLAITTGTNAFISAKVTKTIDLGSHLMFIGEVTESEELDNVPSTTYTYYQEHIKPQPKPASSEGKGRTVWRCKVCGYIYDGENLPDDFICPICKHPAIDFEQVTID